MKKALKVIAIIVIVILILAVIAAVGMSAYIGSAVFEGMTNVIPREETLKTQAGYIGEY